MQRGKSKKITKTSRSRKKEPITKQKIAVQKKTSASGSKALRTRKKTQFKKRTKSISKKVQTVKNRRTDTPRRSLEQVGQTRQGIKKTQTRATFVKKNTHQ